MHEFAKRVGTRCGPILAKQECFAMSCCVVLTDKQPPRIDGKLAHECGNDVDEKQDVDDAILLADECPESRGRNAERLGKCLERRGGLARDDSANSLDDGFEERVVDRLRQGSAPRWLDGKDGLSPAKSVRA